MKVVHFTLIELLLVTAVIAILAGLLFPSLAAARQRACDLSCLSLMRQYGTATSLYANDHGDYFPDIRTYLTPTSAFPGYFTSAILSEKITRCPGDSSTEILNRLGIYETCLKVSIGGTSNLTDSRSQTRNGFATISQARFMPQNAQPARRCLWTDYQNQEPDKTISGAGLHIWKGTTTSATLHQYVFRHRGNAANGAFADGHAATLHLLVPTANNGHDLSSEHVWILPANNTFPYGPRQLSAPDSPVPVSPPGDTPSVTYR